MFHGASHGNPWKVHTALIQSPGLAMRERLNKQRTRHSGALTCAHTSSSLCRMTALCFWSNQHTTLMFKRTKGNEGQWDLKSVFLCHLIWLKDSQHPVWEHILKAQWHQLGKGNTNLFPVTLASPDKGLKLFKNWAKTHPVYLQKLKTGVLDIGILVYDMVWCLWSAMSIPGHTT